MTLTPAQQALLSYTPTQRAEFAQQKAIFGAAPEDSGFPWLTVGLLGLTFVIVTMSVGADSK